MASELNHHVGYSRANECWFVRFYPYQTEQQAIVAVAAFTRPAPVDTNPLTSNPVDDKIAPDTDGKAPVAVDDSFAQHLERSCAEAIKSYNETPLSLRGPVVLPFDDELIKPRAPAATDTGLVTVEYQVRLKLNGHWVQDNFLSQQLSPDTERRELVTRSQAEELLAAKDKTIALAETTMIEMHQDLNKLEAKLAAANGKIEALVQSLAYETAHEATKRAEAAEKALEPFALISSEGVIKQESGHVTVITCAEYFHKARAVLEGKPS